MKDKDKIIEEILKRKVKHLIAEDMISPFYWNDFVDEILEALEQKPIEDYVIYDKEHCDKLKQEREDCNCGCNSEVLGSYARCSIHSPNNIAKTETDTGKLVDMPEINLKPELKDATLFLKMHGIGSGSNITTQMTAGLMVEFAHQYTQSQREIMDEEIRKVLIGFSQQFYADEETCIHNVNEYLRDN